jgi:hypothetical protein
MNHPSLQYGPPDALKCGNYGPLKGNLSSFVWLWDRVATSSGASFAVFVNTLRVPWHL